MTGLAASPGAEAAARLLFVLVVFAAYLRKPVTERDWPTAAVVLLVLLFMWSAVWVWSLSDLTGGWYSPR